MHVVSNSKLFKSKSKSTSTIKSKTKTKKPPLHANVIVICLFSSIMVMHYSPPTSLNSFDAAAVDTTLASFKDWQNN